MNESERDLLTVFLRQLVHSRTTPGDVAANNLIQKAVRSQPNASYLLVQRALALEAELAVARQRILVLEGRASAPVQVPLATDFLDPQATQWGMQPDREAQPTPSKLLFDIFMQQRSPKGRDLESRVVSFVGRHAGSMWLVILSIVVLVVLFKDKLV